MRIGFISTMGVSPWGGSEELWAATALEALNAGHKVFVSVVGWNNTPSKLVALEGRGAKILRRYNPDYQIRGALFGFASSYRDLFKANPDVIVVSLGGAFDVVSSAELLELLTVVPIPFVLVCQFTDSVPVLTDRYTREHAANIFSRAFRVLFVSNQNRIDVERELVRKIPNAGLVLNPVNLSDTSYLPWPESRTARFASVARLEARHKGQDILIEALSAGQWRQRDWHLTLYGSGSDEGYMRSLVDFLGLQDRITFAGHTSDVRAIWAQEQVLLMFSRAEGTPLALVEAMLCGRPAIVSDVGGNQEWIAEAQTGFVAEAPTIGLARAALERAWAARSAWPAMGIEAHKTSTARISDPTILGLLEVVQEASRCQRPADAVTGREADRQQRYRRLLVSTLGGQAKRVTKAGALRAAKLLSRWRAERKRALLRLVEPNLT